MNQTGKKVCNWINCIIAYAVFYLQKLIPYVNLYFHSISNSPNNNFVSRVLKLPFCFALFSNKTMILGVLLGTLVNGTLINYV